jgi:HlyD family secretion protein
LKLLIFFLLSRAPRPCTDRCGNRDQGDKGITLWRVRLWLFRLLSRKMVCAVNPGNAPQGTAKTGATAMSAKSETIFRTAAMERLSSPEQLDQLIDVTRPADWIAALVIGLALVGTLVWSVVGRIPTRVTGEGILISDAGRVVDAVSAVAGRLASVEVSVGDRVVEGQVIARISQTDIEQRYRNATEVWRERQREHAELVSAIERELEIKAANFAAQKSGLEQLIAASEQRVAYLTQSVLGLEGLNVRGFVTRRELEDRRADLDATRQRVTEARNEIQRIDGLKRESETQRELDRLASQFKVNEARRQMDQLASTLERDSNLTSPIDGRVIEIKVSSGGVLAAGTPVAAIETEGKSLQAIVYIPADRGKNVQPGMEVRIEPSTVKREEFGTMIGKVSTVSGFPVTPEGMAAVLHNEALAKRFSREGAPYAIVVQLERDRAAVSGYRWSSGPGPPIRLTTGTLARAEVTTRQQPPIDLVVPIMRRLSGIGD